MFPLRPALRRRLGALGRPLSGLLLLGLTMAAAADAQVLRGSVRTLDTSLPVPRAQIIVRDSIGRELATAYSDDQGFFTIALRQRVTFSVHARRLGFQMADTDLLRIAEDTVNLEFQMAEVAMEADAINVRGMPSLNSQRLEDAERRGWSVYQPEVVAQHRERSRDLTELLRTLGARNIQMPRHPRDCVRSMRTNRCVTYVVDGQVLGPDAYILPADIYFLAVLTPSESQVMYGNRAMDGAIVVYTRMEGDRYDENRLPPHLRGTMTREPRATPAASTTTRSRPPEPGPGSAAPEGPRKP